MVKMKTIPQVREELLYIANSNSVDETAQRSIKRLVKSLYRRPAVRRAATEHAKVTTSLHNQIKTYAEAHHSMSYAKIGRRFNVSNGRVSEIVAGKRAA